MDRDNRNLWLGIVFSYLTMFAGVVVSLTYTPFFLKALGEQQYGLYNMGQAAVSYLGLAEFGFGNAVVRYSSKYRAEGNEEKRANMYGIFLYIYGVLAVLVLIVGGVICLLSNRIFTVSTGAKGYTELRIIIAIMVINLALTFSNQPYSSIITSYERFTFIKVTNLIYTILKPLVMVPLLVWGYKAVALSLVSFALQQLLNFLNVYYVRRVLHIRINRDKDCFDFEILKEIINYSFFIFLGAIVAQLNDNTDSVILGIISGEVAVAVYSVGRQITGYIQQIPGVVSSVFFPRVTLKITNKSSMEEMTDLMISVGRIQLFLLGLVTSGFIIFGREFLFLWAGEAYESAYWIVLSLIIPGLIPNIQQIGVFVIQAMNKHQFRAMLYIICAVINVVSSIPMGLKYGGVGCALCTGITTLITSGFVMNWYYNRIGLNIPRFWGNILSIAVKIIPISIGGYYLNSLCNTNEWGYLAIKIVGYAVIYGSVVFICMNNNERTFVKKLLGRMRG